MSNESVLDRLRGISGLPRRAPMNTGDKLKLLLANCKCGVHITVNRHRDYYETAEQALAENDKGECPVSLEPGVRAEIIRTNTLVEVHFYPSTPVGFYQIYHHHIDAALDEAIECLRQDGLV